MRARSHTHNVKSIRINTPEEIAHHFFNKYERHKYMYIVGQTQFYKALPLVLLFDIFFADKW